jgi:hypothetical protein
VAALLVTRTAAPLLVRFCGIRLPNAIGMRPDV